MRHWRSLVEVSHGQMTNSHLRDPRCSVTRRNLLQQIKRSSSQTWLGLELQMSMRDSPWMIKVNTILTISNRICWRMHTSWRCLRVWLSNKMINQKMNLMMKILVKVQGLRTWFVRRRDKSTQLVSILSGSSLTVFARLLEWTTTFQSLKKMTYHASWRLTMKSSGQY